MSRWILAVCFALLSSLALAQDPAPGAENEGEVRLTIARRPVVFPLLTAPRVESSGVELDTYRSNAVAYPDSWRFLDNAFTERDLGRGFRVLAAVYGVEDDDAIDTVYAVTVIGDNRILFEGTVGFGETKELAVDVTDILRLRVEANELEGNGQLILGTPRLLGLEDEVPEF